MPKNKTYGLYSCPIRILTDARCVILGLRSIIITISVQKGVFPSKLKKAKVVPVYKNDDKPEPGNYRSISLLSIFNRIFEKLKYHRLKSFRGKNYILFKGAFHLSELTDQPIPLVMRISLLVKTNHPNQSNPKYYTQRR